MKSQREIRKRILSVRNMQQITKAMKMVAAAKLRRAQQRIEGARAYGEMLKGALGRLAARSEGVELTSLHGNRNAYLVFSSDRGLCGSFNANVIRRVRELMQSDRDGKFVLIGKKGINSLKRFNTPTIHTIPEFYAHFDMEHLREWGDTILDVLRENGCGKLFAVYNQFSSSLAPKITVEQLLPVPLELDSDDVSKIITEPSAEELLPKLVDHYSVYALYQVSVDSIAAELGARMVAMDAATNNASEMIDTLTLEMNRARQAAITTELSEIIGGAEALKG